MACLNAVGGAEVHSGEAAGAEVVAGFDAGLSAKGSQYHLGAAGSWDCYGQVTLKWDVPLQKERAYLSVT